MSDMPLLVMTPNSTKPPRKVNSLTEARKYFDTLPLDVKVVYVYDARTYPLNSVPRFIYERRGNSWVKGQ
jgi:hypothetical protein